MVRKINKKYKLRNIFDVTFAKDLVIIFIFLIISTVAVTNWFKDALLINIADFDFPISPTNDFINSLFVWKQSNLGYAPPFRSSARAFLNFWIAFLYSNGFSISFIEKSCFVFLNFISSISMYFLIKYILQNDRFATISSFIGANFYMFNTYLMLVKWSNGYIVSLFSYASLPFILLFFMKYLYTSKKRYLSLFGIFSFFAIPSADNPAYFLLIFVIVIFYGFYFAFIFKRNIRYNMIFAILVLLLLCSVWLLPSITYALSQELFSSFILDLDYIKVESVTNFSEIFRFLGFWVLKGTYFGEYYFPYWETYYNPLIIFLGFIITIISFSNLLKLTNKNQLFFDILAIFGVFFMKGISPPFEYINIWFYRYFPFFFAFRQPYEKFGIFFIFSIAVLLGISVQNIIVKLNNIKNKLVRQILLIFSASILFLAINVYAWPFWTGDIFPHYDQSSVLKSARIYEIPEMYKKIAEEINSHPALFRIIVLPGGTGLGWTPFTWGYLGPHPLYHYIFGKSLFMTPGGPWASSCSAIDCYLLNLEHRGDFSALVKVSGYLNLKYVILDKSIDYAFYHWIKKPEVIEHELTNIKGITFMKSYNELNLYKLSDDFFLPRIYSSSEAIEIKENIDEMFKIINDTKFGKIIFIFLNKENQKEAVQMIHIAKNGIGESNENIFSKPHIRFRQINPTKYEVKVENATQPFFLVLSESYDINWKIYLSKGSSTEFCKIISEYQAVNVLECEHCKFKFSLSDILFIFQEPIIEEKYHFIANGYANAWYIDPRILGSTDFTLIIYYKIQSYNILGILISLLVFFVCLVYLIVDIFNLNIIFLFNYLKTNFITKLGRASC